MLLTQGVWEWLVEMIMLSIYTWDDTRKQGLTMSYNTSPLAWHRIPVMHPGAHTLWPGIDRCCIPQHGPMALGPKSSQLLGGALIWPWRLWAKTLTRCPRSAAKAHGIGSSDAVGLDLLGRAIPAMRHHRMPNSLIWGPQTNRSNTKHY
jgi:hypothetical protein